MGIKTKLILFLPVFYCGFVENTLLKRGRRALKNNFGRDFSIYWNTPSAKCVKLGVDLELDKFGISHNEEQSWNGSVINIFYSGYGKWPYYENGKDINGGIPQRKV